MAISPEQSLLDLAARTATADSDLLHINSGGEDYKQAKSDFVSDLAQEVTFNTSSSLTSQVNTYSSARGAGYYFGKIASYGAQAVTGVPENDNYYVEFIVWDANNCKLTVSSTSVDKVFDQWKGGGTWSGTWQQRPRRSEITSLNNSLMKSLPPNFNSITSQSLTNGNATQITSTGAWYAVRTINTSTSGDCSSYILDSSNTNYLGAVSAPQGTFVRSMTPWLYFPSGAKFYVRSIFASSGGTGELLKAPNLS